MTDEQMTGDARKRPAMPRAAMLLGAAGLLPQIAALLIIIGGDPHWMFTAQAMAFAYAAIIFSFLGGLWWGLAARYPLTPQWIYVASVVPSLIALGSAWPWATGASWPGPSMIVLGLANLISPVVDRVLVHDGTAPGWWMRLRLPLSVGLGGLTLAIGLLS